MSCKRVQLNTRIPQKLREKVQQDSDRHKSPKITRDVVVSAILEDFFKSWTVSERNQFYRKFLSKGCAAIFFLCFMAGASTFATVTDPKREPGASAVSGLTVRQFLSALSELESGNNDFAKGRAHEVGRYQCLPSVWRNATALPLTAATNQTTAATETLSIIRSRTGKDASELTPSQFAIAWHCPNARRLNREQRDYVTRFENLFAKYHL